MHPELGENTCNVVALSPDADVKSVGDSLTVQAFRKRL
jgi:hypothetical protein